MTDWEKISRDLERKRQENFTDQMRRDQFRREQEERERRFQEDELRRKLQWDQEKRI